MVGVLTGVTGLTACTSTVVAARTPAVASPASSAPRPTALADRPGPRRTPPAAPALAALPLAFSTGRATQVITVVAPRAGDTTAVMQSWQKTSLGWTRHGPALTADVGRAGLSAHKREGFAATPIGSFTITQSFGRDRNPGTLLPYTQTTPADWWISQPSPVYNTRQHCAGSCGFAQGAPNEHLYYENPYYNYALVIDYNTRNAPGGVRPGAGSAIFLHVTVGQATAGCVSISQSGLASIMRWLRPSAHPRILVGIAP